MISGTPPPLEIRLFGLPEVWVNGLPIPRLRSKKGLWTLGALVLRGGLISRESLAAMLWPEATLSEGLGNLRPILSELRTALGSEGVRLRSPDRGTVAFDLEGCEIDVMRFDREIDSPESVVMAVDRYRGPLMEGCSLEIFLHERESREAACLQGLLHLVQASPAEESIRFARRAVEIAPLRDEPRRSLMRSLAAGGDPNAALQTYRDFARLLSREMGGVPDPQTQALYAELRTSASRPQRLKGGRSGVPNNLPRLLDGLIGREDERAEVIERLKEARLVTLVGMGGIGKTRLALSIAERSLEDFPQGVWFVPLDLLDDERDVVPSIAQAIGAHRDERRPTLDAIVDALGERPALLVLDNCEHVLDSASRVAAFLLRSKPSLRILATSRQPLGLPGETAWPVPPLATPELSILPEGKATLMRVAMAFESVRLFLERAQATESRFELVDGNVSAVIAICAELEGIPLALELAATRVRSMPISALAERLRENRLEVLESRRGSEGRQATLRAMLDWSYDLLSPSERRLLAALSVFVGGWTKTAAERVCGIDSRVLGLLVSKSLVTWDEATSRYRLLETVRQYAAAKLGQTTEERSARTLHRAWCAEFAEAAEPEFGASEHEAWLRKVRAEMPNLRAALQYGEDDPLTGLRIAGRLWRFFEANDPDEAEEILDQALGHPGAQAPTRERAQALYGGGTIAAARGDHALSFARFEACREIRHALGEPLD